MQDKLDGGGLYGFACPTEELWCHAGTEEAGRSVLCPNELGSIKLPPPVRPINNCKELCLAITTNPSIHRFDAGRLPSLYCTHSLIIIGGRI